MQKLKSRIIICNGIRLNKDYVNVLNYTENEMLSLCETNKVAEKDDYSFIRNKGTISTGFDYETVLQCNYIAFQNKDYSNKWFFAFIDDVIYNGESNTEIKYTIDIWSTWFDYWTEESCFVVREHVNDDTVGLHTVPENLDVGQLICDYEYIANEIGAESYYYIVIASNYDPSNQTRYSGMGIYADYPQGSMWFAWLINRSNYATEVNSISQWIYDVTTQGHASDITAIFALPYQAFNLTGDIDTTTHLVGVGKGKKLQDSKTFLKSSFRAFSDYTPKNNKLFVYPTSFCRVTNNMGAYNDYKIEDFNEYNVQEQLTDNMTFEFLGVPCLRIWWKNTT